MQYKTISATKKDYKISYTKVSLKQEIPTFLMIYNLFYI